MKTINTQQILKDFKGEDIKSSDDGKKVIIGDFLSNIMASNAKNPSLAWQLGKKFACDKKVDLKAEEVVFVKESIEDASTGERRWVTAMVAGQLIEILDSKDKSEKE
jgi:hypothetical protein